MLNPRKASPALYELLGRHTRITSGKQIGGRATTDGRDEAEAQGLVAPPEFPEHHRHPTPPATPRVSPFHHADKRDVDHDPAHRSAPLNIARSPVHTPHAPAPTREPVHAGPREPEPEYAPTVPLGPGRAVRVPTGYFLFGLAAVIAATVGGYMFGWVQKEREYNQSERLEAQRNGPALTDPLGDESPTKQETKQALPQKNPPAGNPASPQPKASTPAKPVNPPGVTPAPAKGVIIVEKGVADPREKGKNYAVVASLGKDKAVELAQFLAKEGVESAVLPSNNAGLYPVVSLSGFAKDDFRGKAKQDHENRLRELGKQYAKLGGGRTDFSDLWWLKFDG